MNKNQEALTEKEKADNRELHKEVKQHERDYFEQWHTKNNKENK